MSELTSTKIKSLLNQLNYALAEKTTHGELMLVGGAVMTLVFQSRDATHDLDAVFEPKSTLLTIAKNIAQKEQLPADWLNDAVKGFLSPLGEFDNYLKLSHLSVYTAKPEYLLAMKTMSMRLGPEFKDLEDVRYLLRYLNITTRKQAESILCAYYPLKQYPQKSFYALDELLENK